MRSVWQRTAVYVPLAFLAIGLGLSAFNVPDGPPLAVVFGVGAAVLIAYWLGRRSKVENTAVAVAQAVSVAVAEATANARAEATAQALSQVAVYVGEHRAENALADPRTEKVLADPARVFLHEQRADDYKLDSAGPVSETALAFEEFAARQVAREAARESHQEAPLV